MKPKKPPKNPTVDVPTEIRAIARERVGSIKPSQTINPKNLRRKPKHKAPPTADSE
jgi:hypothetical protein